MEVGRVEGTPPAHLRGAISSYFGFGEVTPGALRRREGPGCSVVLNVSFGEEWVINGERFTSFAAGLHDQQVTTEHGGRSFGMHVNIAPPAAYALFGVPLHTLALRTVALDAVFDQPFLVERLHDAPDWEARFTLLDEVLAQRFARGRAPTPGVVWAWRELAKTHGRVPIGRLATELGWSRKRIVARFREEVGVAPKTLARLLRFERAKALAEQSERPDWARIALDCGYYDQSHLSNDFRAVTGRTPATFFQDGGTAG